MTGCAIGEVMGMVIGTALGWSNAPTTAVSVALAFLFGYGPPWVRSSHPGSPPPSF